MKRVARGFIRNSAGLFAVDENVALACNQSSPFKSILLVRRDEYASHFSFPNCESQERRSVNKTESGVEARSEQEEEALCLIAV